MTTIELKRQEIQYLLDSQKSASERNKMGQYSTPYTLAKQICEYIVSSFFNNSIPSFLEPSIGTGVFYSALTELAEVNDGCGYEIDAHYCIPAKQLWKSHNITIINKDFLKETPHKKFSLIIANPPYSRHHHIPFETKKELGDRIHSSFGIELSGLSGLYCYFMLLSTLWLEKNGISCWLIPSEFMSVNYGKEIKEFLLSKVDLLSIHSFDCNDLKFDDALVSSCVVVFRNSQPDYNNKVMFSWGNDLSTPTKKLEISKAVLTKKKKWSEQYLTSEIIDDNQPTLGSFFKIKRGIATGSNKFFIVDHTTIEEYNLPKELLIEVVPPPRKLKSNIYCDDTSEGNRMFLIGSNLPIETIKVRYPGYYEYIQEGIRLGINSLSNCRHRDLWYNCETRKPAPILVSYMGRVSNTSAFRFILNKTKAIATNSYLMLYPRDEYAHLMTDETIKSQVWNCLQAIPNEELVLHGRTYGGGLFKLEPNELSEIRCSSLKSILKPIQPSLFD